MVSVEVTGLGVAMAAGVAMAVVVGLSEGLERVVGMAVDLVMGEGRAEAVGLETEGIAVETVMDLGVGLGLVTAVVGKLRISRMVTSLRLQG